MLNTKQASTSLPASSPLIRTLYALHAEALFGHLIAYLRRHFRQKLEVLRALSSLHGANLSPVCLTPGALLPFVSLQLLELVVSQPNKSTVDMRFLSHIWEAFLRWCAEQFEAKVGVKVLGMGEFCYRKDSIGGMEFFNPMFVIAESFARAYGLHDRRPKTHAVETESIELDMLAIAARTTDLLGEVVGKEVVDNALHDIIERIGQTCADPDTYGIVTVDFGFAKLFCENKSLEFAFGAGGGKPPSTGASTRSIGGTLQPKGGGGASSSSFGLDGTGLQRKLAETRKKPDAPLQRPHRPHMKPVFNCDRYTKEDLLTSHAKQLTEKELVASAAREEETVQHLETLQRLRSEMVLDYSQREQRRELTKLLAGHQKVQQDEKRGRDEMDRRVYGMDHWPFRTEEQVQEAISATNAAQKAYLDKQLAEKAEKLEYLKREAAKRQAKEQQQALEELRLLESEKRGGRGAPAAKGAPPMHSVEKTLEDAFSRYEDYLHTRKEGIELNSSFQREQRYLSEQAELLKGEEQRRRLAEMRSYLEKQMTEKEAARAKEKTTERLQGLAGKLPISALPTGSEIDAEEEAYVKMALKHALDGQVERKQANQTALKAQDLSQEQQALSHVAREMQEARYRTWSERKQQEEALRQTWAKQQQLKLMEATLDKAEAA